MIRFIVTMPTGQTATIALKGSDTSDLEKRSEAEFSGDQSAISQIKESLGSSHGPFGLLLSAEYISPPDLEFALSNNEFDFRVKPEGLFDGYTYPRPPDGAIH